MNEEIRLRSARGRSRCRGIRALKGALVILVLERSAAVSVSGGGFPNGCWFGSAHHQLQGQCELQQQLWSLKQEKSPCSHPSAARGSSKGLKYTNNSTFFIRLDTRHTFFLERAISTGMSCTGKWWGHCP